MTEQGFTNEQAIIILSILIPLLIYQLHKLNAKTIIIEPKARPERKDHRKLTNANYGAYIQAQGRYYN